MTSDVQQRLLAVQQELADVRQALTSRAGTGLDAADPMTGRVIGRFLAAAGLGGLALIPLIITVLSLGAGDPGVAFTALPFGAALAYAAYRVSRPALLAVLSGSGERDRLLVQERRLLEQAERLRGDGGDGSAPGRTPVGSGELPAAPDHQPSAYAQMMHARFPVGRSPERHCASCRHRRRGGRWPSTARSAGAPSRRSACSPPGSAWPCWSGRFERRSGIDAVVRPACRRRSVGAPA